MFTRKSKKDMNFELNIVSFIDVMSVLITFLLMVTVWIHLASVDVSQATGETGAQKETPPSVTAELDIHRNIILSVKNSKVANSRFVIASRNKQINFNEVARNISAIRSRDPQLVTGLIFPAAQTKYEEVIQLMDQFKSNGVNDIGISPL